MAYLKNQDAGDVISAAELLKNLYDKFPEEDDNHKFKKVVIDILGKQKWLKGYAAIPEKNGEMKNWLQDQNWQSSLSWQQQFWKRS